MIVKKVIEERVDENRGHFILIILDGVFLRHVKFTDVYIFRESYYGLGLFVWRKNR